VSDKSSSELIRRVHLLIRFESSLRRVDTPKRNPFQSCLDVFNATLERSLVALGDATLLRNNEALSCMRTSGFAPTFHTRIDKSNKSSGFLHQKCTTCLQAVTVQIYGVKHSRQFSKEIDRFWLGLGALGVASLAPIEEGEVVMHLRNRCRTQVEIVPRRCD
jgi:hypothetical protein